MTEQNVTPPRTRRWVKILLIASLGFNLLIIGLVFGALASGQKFAGKAPGFQTVGFAVRSYVKPLPDAQKAELREGLRATRQERRAAQRELRMQAQRVLDAIAAEPFDKAALKKAFDQQGEIASGMLNSGRDNLVEVISKMNSTERAVYAAKVKEHLERRKGRYKKGPKSQRDK